jgi:hypothetical protein
MPRCCLQFRARLIAHGLEEQFLDTLLVRLDELGLVKAGGKQRTDSTHVLAAVRDLNRLELAGESVRAVVEALAVAAPDWLPTVIDVHDWSQRYGARVDSWRLPASAVKRTQLAQTYGSDALALLRAVYAPQAPDWLRELPAVEVLRRVLVQNYHIRTDTRRRTRSLSSTRAGGTASPPWPGPQRLRSTGHGQLCAATAHPWA